MLIRYPPCGYFVKRTSVSRVSGRGCDLTKEKDHIFCQSFKKADYDPSLAICQHWKAQNFSWLKNLRWLGFFSKAFERIYPELSTEQIKTCVLFHGAFCGWNPPKPGGFIIINRNVCLILNSFSVFCWLITCYVLCYFPLCQWTKLPPTNKWKHSGKCGNQPMAPFWHIHMLMLTNVYYLYFKKETIII